jgi:2-polyprenyl-3-methyl-5-hydroxy-6-metoxy-1,4-benzoquinol methylase
MDAQPSAGGRPASACYTVRSRAHQEGPHTLRSLVNSVSRLVSGAPAPVLHDAGRRSSFPESIAARYPATFPPAWAATERILAGIPRTDFTPLERRSPGLKGYDWETYLRLSSIRMAAAAAALWPHVPRGARILDVGAYFGNFALMFRDAGYEIDAVDSYAAYGGAFAHTSRLFAESGVRRLDFDDVGLDLRGMPPAGYDAVMCMGVIEHVPHTPRLLLEAVDRVLTPGGLFLMDTPNLAYIYNRQKLARGESIFCPISAQFHTEIPFEGHHREYTIGEIEWMTERIGHEKVSLETFNYSLYGLSVLQGDDLANVLETERDPTCREVILSLSRKKGTAAVSPGREADPRP